MPLVSGSAWQNVRLSSLTGSKQCMSEHEGSCTAVAVCRQYLQVTEPLPTAQLLPPPTAVHVPLPPPPPPPPRHISAQCQGLDVLQAQDTRCQQCRSQTPQCGCACCAASCHAPAACMAEISLIMFMVVNSAQQAQPQPHAALAAQCNRPHTLSNRACARPSSAIAVLASCTRHANTGTFSIGTGGGLWHRRRASTL